MSCACIRANVCAREDRRKDGECMKRERNDGKRDGGNTWSDSLGPERVQGALHVTPCTIR